MQLLLGGIPLNICHTSLVFSVYTRQAFKVSVLLYSMRKIQSCDQKIPQGRFTIIRFFNIIFCPFVFLFYLLFRNIVLGVFD